ncbi:MAG: FAD-binding oxidoreductase [Ideonella sp.]|nr:FAD-binding oxidoreductase [Ideonella sp.]
MTIAEHARKMDALRAALAQPGVDGGKAAFGLAKPTSNLFRDVAREPAPRIGLHHFNQVIEVDPAAGTVTAEGMTTYADLVDATLARGTMPCVVPQLKSITIGGALAGVGIEATSFRHGLVHETVTAFDVLTGDGRILHCTPDNAQRALFHGFANSYGTLGYALAVTARTQPVRPFVAIEHRRYAQAARCLADVEDLVEGGDIDFLDGVAFAPDDLVLTLGRFVDAAPYASDYGFEHIYWRSLRARERDFLATRDFLWRWDTDWFWCSRQFGAQHALVRRLLGRKRLNSVTYQRAMRWNSRWGFTRTLNRLRGVHAESVIQDVDIPLEHGAGFLDFLAREIGIWPVWLCPLRARDPAARFTLYPLQPQTTYLNFGFWDVVSERTPRPPGFHNRKIELEVARLGGLKSLYSDSYYSEAEFWALHDRAAYAQLKRAVDPADALGDLYAKCVRHR